MRTIIGHDKRRDTMLEGDVESASDLNWYFNRFDTHSPLPSPPSSFNSSDPPPPLSPSPAPTTIFLSADNVKKELCRLHPCKAVGPAGTSPRVLNLASTHQNHATFRYFQTSLLMWAISLIGRRMQSTERWWTVLWSGVILTI